MSYGPSDFGSVLQGVGSWANAIAIGFAAVWGAKTFKNWQKQKITEKRMAHAERILVATFKFRNALNYVRSGPNAAELRVALAELGHLSGEPSEHLYRQAVSICYKKRLDQTWGDQVAFHDCIPMAVALFGLPMNEPMQELSDQFRRLHFYVEAHSLRRELHTPEFEQEIQFAMHFGKSPGQTNEMDDKVEACIAKIVETCSAALKYPEG
ncbi:MAG: hypothetical protein ABGX15_01470 [Paracoccaceae bacterium]|jgi:hypothetical protein